MNIEKKLAQVFHFDLQGKREFKYDFLNENNIASIDWKELNPTQPNLFFVPKNFDLDSEYSKGFKIDELLLTNSNGIETKCDSLAIQFDKQILQTVIEDFKKEEVQTLKLKYNEKEDSSGWNFSNAKRSLQTDDFYQQKIHYRPFDFRETIITKNSGGFIGRSRFEVMKHFLHPNIGLIIPRQTNQDYRHNFITNKIIEGNITASAKLFGSGCLFPLYLYPETKGQQTIDQSNERTPNLNIEIVNEIAKKLGLVFTNEKDTSTSSVPKHAFAPIDMLDYIYAVLHSPTYREKYKEFLKIDFPRVPYPTNAKTFWQLVALGKKIREIHLLESPIVEKYITKYPVDGDNVVTKPRFEPYIYVNEIPDENGIINYPNYLGNVFINDTQYFADVPTSAWEFYIGGYQPAQKWLKDRKGRALDFEDILHYQKIIVALKETSELMREIDGIDIEGN